MVWTSGGLDPTLFPSERALPFAMGIADKARDMNRVCGRLFRITAFAMVAMAVVLTCSKAEVPAFPTLFELVRTNVTGISSERLNELAVLGFLEKLGGAAHFVTNNDVDGNLEKSVARATLLENHFGYLRLGEIESGTGDTITRNLDEWRSSHELYGVVLDLRFASGRDFKAAAEVAGLFFPPGQPILDWGEGPIQSASTSKQAIPPVTVLVNRQTRGAPEAIAGTLRSAGLALILGSTTAGEAAVYRDFLVANGDHLRIAVGQVRTGNGSVLSTEGLIPDIAISTPPTWERAYLSDPFTAVTTTTNSVTATNQVVASVRIRRRVNEAELVRSKQQGVEPGTEVVKPVPTEQPRLIRDPALARAVDLLKGLRIVRGESGGQ